jgi:flavorubredoxin
MPIELYNDGNHICLMFNDLVTGDVAVQANQFLIVSQKEGALIDPSGNMTFNALSLAILKYFPYKKLKYLLASHQDPDIIASLNKWLFSTDCHLYVSQLWSRFVPHFCNVNRADDRITGIPDEGMSLMLGNSRIFAVPAHFLHAEGNFQFYDEKSKILFSGDMGASMVDDHTITQPITTKAEFLAHLPAMSGFHKRYMVSNKVCRYWANMVRDMLNEGKVSMLVPQHGRYFVGAEAIHAFLDWVSELSCGVDLFTQLNYRFPTAT